MTYGMLEMHHGKSGSMNYFEGIYKGKRVLITGNTGFKGSWLGEWLTLLGAEVVGFSLENAANQAHFDMLSPGYKTFFADIRNLEQTVQIMAQVKPDIVFHLAAQALVIDSYHSPIETYQTNVMGTLHVLEASRLAGVSAVVVVTSDKCYENKEWIWGYRENDPFGGHDMYSSSKGCAEVLTQSYRSSFCNSKDGMKVASARAGNVIGGGDFSANRIVPDLIKSVEQQTPVEIRNPLATRPWQHVLEPLSGYLLLGMNLLKKNKVDEGWNFGPSIHSNCSVEQLVSLSTACWSEISTKNNTDPNQVHEAHLLMLDCSKANKMLHWQPIWELNETVEHTIAWYKTWHETKRVLTKDQIIQYGQEAELKQLSWAG
jgi:CDP-glucose 4,6-dehydratase